MATVLDDFWAGIDAQLAVIRTATSAAQVVAAMPPVPGLSSCDGFFGGSGGDDTVYEALLEAGWTTVWSEADYFWCMRAPDGSQLTYIEGDLVLGNARPMPRRNAPVTT